MDLKRYEKINGREALRRLADGEKVYGAHTNEWWQMQIDGSVTYESKTMVRTADISLTNFGKAVCLFVKKPFDVRQEMRDRPNEWVAKYNVETEEGDIWYYIGFDTDGFCALRMKKRNKHGMKEPVKWNGGNVVYATPEDLDACIPIDEVSE